MYDSLDILKPDKTNVFENPLITNETLVRTGVIADGSCLIHSILYAFSSSYREMNITERMAFVKRLRKNMSVKITRELWRDLGDGLIAKIPFQEIVAMTFNDVYMYFSGKKLSPYNFASRKVINTLINNEQNTEQTFEIYRIITQILTLEKLEQNILPDAYVSVGGNTILSCHEHIKREIQSFLETNPILRNINNDKARMIKRITMRMVNEILVKSEDEAYESYTRNISNFHTHIDLSTVNLYSELFDRNIYFIDGKTRLPYNTLIPEKEIKERKSVVVLWVKDVHFEIIGRLTSGNRITREFDHDDDLIEKIRLYMMHPNKFSQNRRFAD